MDQEKEMKFQNEDMHGKHKTQVGENWTEEKTFLKSMSGLKY